MAEMEIARNDMVVGPGDVEVGRIEHVIVDGSSGRVAELVVVRRDGTEFTLPIANVRQQGPGVFMMHTAPEKAANEHPFEATEYRAVAVEGADANRVVVPSGSTPVVAPTSGGAIHRDSPRTGAFAPAPSPTTGIRMPPASAQPLPSPPAQPPPVPRLDHPPEMNPRSLASASESNRAGAIRPEPAGMDIAATRSEMRGTVDAPQEKPFPDRLKDQVADAAHAQVAAVKTQVTDAVHDQIAATKDQLHDVTVGQVATTVDHVRDTAQGTASDIIGIIRANPVPATLLGIGIGWLWNEHRRSSQAGTGTDRHGSPLQGRAMPPAYRSSGSDRDDALVLKSDDDSLGEKVGDAAAHAKDAVGRVAEQTQERASHIAGQVGETVGDVAGATQDRVSDLTHGVQRTAGGLGSNVVAIIRANPIPAALTGVGIGWLLTNRSQGAGAGNRSAYRGGSSSSTGTYDSAPRHAESGEGMIDALGDAASAAKEKAGQVAERAGDGASDLAESAQERARDVSDNVQYGALVAQSWLDRTLTENPINIGMVALALGIAAGFVLPKTQTEDELFGDARDTLLTTATESIQKAQKVVQDVQKVVEDIQAPPARR